MTKEWLDYYKILEIDTLQMKLKSKKPIGDYQKYTIQMKKLVIKTFLLKVEKLMKYFPILSKKVITINLIMLKNKNIIIVKKINH